MAAHHRYFVIDIELANGSKHLVGAEDGSVIGKTRLPERC